MEKMLSSWIIFNFSVILLRAKDIISHPCWKHLLLLLRMPEPGQ